MMKQSINKYNIFKQVCKYIECLKCQLDLMTKQQAVFKLMSNGQKITPVSCEWSIYPGLNKTVKMSSKVFVYMFQLIIYYFVYKSNIKH